MYVGWQHLTLIVIVRGIKPNQASTGDSLGTSCAAGIRSNAGIAYLIEFHLH